MSHDPMEILSSFMDGEEVEPAALAEALTVSGARETLLDFALLRARLRDDPARPGFEFYRAMEPLLADRPDRSWWRKLVPVPAPALAVLVLAGMGLGIWGGLELRRVERTRVESPPVPDRVLHFEPGVDWQSQTDKPS